MLTPPVPKTRCNVVEFDKLVDMGPSILPLVVYKLLDISNFTGIFLCGSPAVSRGLLCKSLTTNETSQITL